MTVTALSDAAAAICGRAQVQSGEEPAQRYADGRGGPPLVAAQPATADQIQALVRLAAEHALPVVAWGSGSRQAWGAPPQATDPPLLIDLGGVTEPQQIDADNLTATVGAGMSLAALDRALAAASLRWPVERLEGMAPTVGGTVATAAAGPSHRAIGRTARWVLGIQAVTAAGEIVHAGGQTVKNVAGYDLGRALVGSWGMLGLITAVTVRLAARPAVAATSLLLFDDPSAAAAVAAEVGDHPLGATAVELLHESISHGPAPKARPLSIQMARGTGGAAWALLVRAEGEAERVDALLAAAQRITVRQGGRGWRFTEQEAVAAWKARAHMWRPAAPGVAAGTWSLPPGALAAALTMIPQLVPADRGVRCLVSGHAGDGELHLALVPAAADRPDTAETVAEIIGSLRQAGAGLGGSWRTEAAPAEVWATAGADPPSARRQLFDRFRAAADPAGRFALMRRW